jgi:hypothetical protein
MTPQEFAIAVLSSAGISAALSAGLIWLAKSWISERLRQSIQHEYDQKLASVNSELRAQVDTNLTKLRASIERESDKLRFAASSIGEAQKVVIEKKLGSLETLWGAVIAARANVPPVMGFIDILTVDEYQSSKDHPTFQKLIGEVSEQKLAAMYQDSVGSIERVRPYVGEYLWALWGTYQSIILRTALLLHWGKDDAEKLNWHKDSGIQQLLKAAMTTAEQQAFERVKIAKISWLQSLFERKLLSAMQVVVSGQHFAEEALSQAQAMEEKIAALKPGGSHA